MIPITDLFEAHLTVADLDRSQRFSGDVLKLPLAAVLLEQSVPACMPAASVSLVDPEGHLLEIYCHAGG
jgi:catechol 2,3-dioxygenase-like lactoylglutathione lyase family enzyme